MSEITKYGTGERGTWVYREGGLVPLERASNVDPVAPYIQTDERDPFENPVTGDIETSMSTYRKKLKERGYFEKGNDRMKFELPSRKARMAEVREATLEAERQIKWGMAKSTPEEREKWEQQNRERARKRAQ